MLTISIVETVLIEIETAAAGEAVHHRGNAIVQGHGEEPKPALIHRHARDVVVERAKRRRPKRGRSIRSKTPCVKRKQRFESFRARRIRGDCVEPHTEISLERSKPAPHVGAMRLTKRGEVRIPRQTLQRDDGTDAVRHFANGPAGFGERRDQLRGRRAFGKMFEMKRALLQARIRRQRSHAFSFMSAADDDVQIIRTSQPGAQKFVVPEPGQPCARQRQRRRGHEPPFAADR